VQLAIGWLGGVQAAVMGLDASQDGAVVATEQASDFEQAVVALGVVTHAPPDFLAGARDTASALSAAEFIEQDASTIADLAHECEQVAAAQVFEALPGSGWVGIAD